MGLWSRINKYLSNKAAQKIKDSRAKRDTGKATLTPSPSGSIATTDKSGKVTEVQTASVDKSGKVSTTTTRKGGGNVRVTSGGKTSDYQAEYVGDVQAQKQLSAAQTNVNIDRQERLATTAKQKLSQNQPLTAEEGEAYKSQIAKEQHERYTGERFSILTAPAWLYRRSPAGSQLRYKEQRLREYSEANRPTPEGIASEMQPAYQDAVTTGRYKIDENGYLVGEGKQAWEREFTMRSEAANKQFNANLKKEFPDLAPKWAYDAAIGAWAFTLASPVMTTGGTQQKTIKKQISKNRFEELSKNLDKSLKGDYWTQSGKTVQYKPPTTTAEQAKILDKMLVNAKTQAEKEAILRATYKSLGKDQFSKVISYFPQKFYLGTTTQTSSVNTMKFNIQGFNPTASMDYVGATGAVVGFQFKAPQQTKISSAQFESPFNIGGLGTDVNVDSITGTSSKSRSSFIPAISTATASAVVPASAFTQLSRLKPRIPNFNQGFPTDTGRGKAGFRGFLPLPKISLGADFGNLNIGKVGTKQRFGYTPDFTSLIKGTRGKAPKITKYKGFETRPITSGWTATLGLKPKKRKKR